MPLLIQIFPYIIQGAALGISAAATPGPLQTYLINQTLIGGWRRGAIVAFAPLISDLPVVVLILLLLEQLPAHFIPFISTIGGAFALYLALNLLRQWSITSQKSTVDSNCNTNTHQPTLSKIDEPIRESSNRSTTASVLTRAVLLNLLSPGLYMFWSLVNGPILITALRESVLLGVAFLLSFYLIFLSGMLLIVMIFHYARRLGTQVVRIMTLASIIILGVMGLYLAYEGLSAFTE